MDDENADAARWQPDGFNSWYRMTTKLENHADMEFSTTVPDRELVEMATAIVTRIGGASMRDHSFRQQLYHWVGMATIQGGRVEAAMKRLLIIAGGDKSASFDDVDEVWSTLEKKLRQVAEQIQPPERARQLVETMDWGAKRRVKQNRDDIVHAYWWEFADAGVTRGRFYRKGPNSVILAELTDLQRVCSDLQQYADALDALTMPEWLILYLPRENRAR
jgi:hypothetical protein